MKRLILTTVLALLPTAAIAQTQTIEVDCSAYHRNFDGLWTIMHDNVIKLDGKPITIKGTMSCCFGSNASRLMIDRINVINIIEKSCY